MSRRTHAATRQDVALRAGVAPSTVSLILNRTPGPRIPDETRQRVIAAARDLGYQSSSIARALVTGRTNTIGVVMHFVDQPFQGYTTAILDGFWKGIMGRGYRMLLALGSRDACVGGLYRERSVDGLIVFAAPVESDDDELGNLDKAGFPAVFVGTRPNGIRCDYVDIDNVKVARQATERLIEAGHRRILHLAGPLEVNSAAVDRRKGYLEALALAGIPADEDLIVDCSFNRSFVAERLGRVMDAGVRFTAIFAANLGMAQGALQLLLARGIRVPEEVSLIGIDAERDPDPTGFTIDTYAQPLQAIGLEAASILRRRMDASLAVPGRSTFLPCTYVPGRSIAPPPA